MGAVLGAAHALFYLYGAIAWRPGGSTVWLVALCGAGIVLGLGIVLSTLVPAIVAGEAGLRVRRDVRTTLVAWADLEDCRVARLGVRSWIVVRLRSGRGVSCPLLAAFAGTDADSWLVPTELNHVIRAVQVSPTQRWSQLGPLFFEFNGELVIVVPTEDRLSFRGRPLGRDVISVLTLPGSATAVVLLDYYGDGRGDNLLCVDVDGTVLWQATLGVALGRDSFNDVTNEEDVLRATTLRGKRLRIDPASGAIES